jgi:Fe-S cluster assembly protein SufD
MTLVDPRSGSKRPARGEAVASSAFTVEFERVAAGGTGPAWLLPLRRQALERFSVLGFPGPKDEDWRFTNIAPIVRRTYRRPPPGRAVPASALQPHRHTEAGWTELVFLNGRLTPSSRVAGLAAGVRLGSLRRALEVDGAVLERYLGRHASTDRSAFVALNTAMFEDGACLYVPPDTELAAPIHLLFVTDRNATGSVIHPRSLVVLGRNARASVVETYLSLADSAHWSNPVTEVVLEEGAALELVRVQREAEAAFHLGTTQVHQARDSRLISFSIAFGAAIGRHDLNVVMDGSGVECHLSGLYMAHGHQLLDNHTAVLHAHPNCASREIYKGILDGHSHGVFNGKVYVTPEAQKTDGKQTNRNLLLSDHARVDTKPQLEIFADDVKCTHGATVGRLDETALFYLRSRGIGAEQATKLLTYAFAAEVLEEIPHAAIRDQLERLVMARLKERGAA